MWHQSGYYAAMCYSLLCVGPRIGCWPGNKTLLWVVSACDEYSFDVSQVGDVDMAALFYSSVDFTDASH